MGLQPKPAFISFDAKETKQRKLCPHESFYISTLLTIKAYSCLTPVTRDKSLKQDGLAFITQGEILRSFR